MLKRITSGLLLACILIPGLMYLKDLVTGSTNLKTCARAASESFDAVGGWFTEKTAQAYEDDVAAEEIKLAVDIEEARTALAQMEATGDSAKGEEMKQYLAQLLTERQDVQDLKRAHLNRLNEKRLAHEEFKLMKARHEAAQKQYPIAKKIVQLRADQARAKKLEVNKELAGVVNTFLDAVDGGAANAAEVRALCTKELKPQMTRDKVKGLARTAPAGDMTFKPAGPGAYDVLFGDKPVVKLKLVLRDGEWAVAQVW